MNMAAATEDQAGKTEGERAPIAFLVTIFTVNVLAFFNMVGILVAMVSIAAALDAPRHLTLQLPTALYIAVACAAPATPWLLDRLGARRLLLASIAGMSLTTLAAALTASFWPLLAILFAHGLFCAPVSPATQAAVSQRMGESQRGIGMAVWGAGNYASYLIGPLLAGWLLVHVGWQAILLMPLGFAMLALPLVLLAVPRAVPVFVGADAATLALAPLAVLLLLATASLGPALGWSSPLVLACIAGTAIAMPLYAWRYKHTPEPRFSMHCLRDPFVGLSLLMVLVYNLFSTGLFQLEFIGQETSLGADFMGVRTAVGGGALLIGFIAGGWLIRGRHLAATLLGGIVVTLLGKAGVLAYNIHLSEFWALWPQIVVSIGFGMVTAALATFAYRTAPTVLAPHIATAFILAIYMGASLGAGILEEAYDLFDSIDLSGGMTEAGATLDAFRSEFLVELIGVALLLIPAVMLVRRDAALAKAQAEAGANSARTSPHQ